MARLATRLLVNALVRRVNASGGSAMVLAKGDGEAGSILVLTVERGADPHFFERGLGASGTSELIESGPSGGSDESVADYWQRRRQRDPDLWVIELDVAEAQRFAAEILLA